MVVCMPTCILTSLYWWTDPLNVCVCGGPICSSSAKFDPSYGHCCQSVLWVLQNASFMIRPGFNSAYKRQGIVGHSMSLSRCPASGQKKISTHNFRQCSGHVLCEQAKRVLSDCYAKRLWGSGIFALPTQFTSSPLTFQVFRRAWSTHQVYLSSHHKWCLHPDVARFIFQQWKCDQFCSQIGHSPGSFLLPWEDKLMCISSSSTPTKSVVENQGKTMQSYS